ncbi:hypothetical protein [Flavonifractor sp. An100]|uniref:hypothetical protein n=1 Tax=Flavonifractor sp. An100 TaxID=1965538 RepID=UPI00117A2668|nr:hypothetical protein [Flavonifractor sp. An100]
MPGAIPPKERDRDGKQGDKEQEEKKEMAKKLALEIDWIGQRLHAHKGKGENDKIYSREKGSPIEISLLCQSISGIRQNA